MDVTSGEEWREIQRTSAPGVETGWKIVSAPRFFVCYTVQKHIHRFFRGD